MIFIKYFKQYKLYHYQIIIFILKIIQNRYYEYHLKGVKIIIIPLYSYYHMYLFRQYILQEKFLISLL